MKILQMELIKMMVKTCFTDYPAIRTINANFDWKKIQTQEKF
jgi:hypothetical protein